MIADLATHLFRTERLQAGDSLSEVTASIAARRQIDVRLLPVTDDSVRTMLTLAEKTELGDPGTEVSFQDYFVRLHHDVRGDGRAVRGRRTGAADPGRGGRTRISRAHRGVPVEPDRLDRPPPRRSRRP